MISGHEVRRHMPRRLAIAILALFALVGVTLQTTAAYPMPPSIQGLTGASSQASTDDPFGIANFNCADVSLYGIDKQTNLRAGAIMAKCGGARVAVTRPAPLASSGLAALSRLARPLSYGGPDINVHPPISPSIQSTSFSWKNGSTVVVAYNDLTVSTCLGGGSYSTDGGATFTVLGPDPFCTGHGTNYGDPAVVYDALHAKWIATFLATGCGGQGFGAWNSPDGITWAPAGCAANVSSGSGDRNSAWQDNNPSSPFYGRSYISYNDFSIGSGALRTAFSTDGGTTWSTPVTAFATFRRDVQLSGDTGSSGYVYLSAMDEGGGGAANRTNWMYRSTDGGATFAGVQMNPPYVPPGAAVCTGNPYFYTVTPQIRHMGWGQNGGGPGNTAHYVYAQHGAGADEGNVEYTRSTDAGLTWSAPIRLNTDTTARAQWMPSLGVTTAGALFVKWYDRRNTANNDYEIYGRASLDNGQTWQPDMAVSDAVIPQPIVQTANCYMGDYDYWSANGTTVQGAWTDSRGAGSGGTQDVFHDGVIPLQGTPTPTVTGTPPTATPTRTPTATPSQTPTPCGNNAGYIVAQGTGTIVPGTTDTGNRCDDCLTTVALPFTYNLYGTGYSVAAVDSNGTLQLVANGSTFTNTCLPATGDTYTIFPYWDDQLTVPTGKGIFTSISGTAPNRIFNIEWRTCGYATGATCLANSDANYEVRLYEGQNKFDIVYGPMASAQTGNSATIGVQKDATLFTQYSCNTAVPGLIGLLLTFSQPSCGTSTPTVTYSPTVSSTPTVCPLQFQDANSTNPFYAFIRCLACRGIISGYTCGGPGEPCGPSGNPYFRPNNNITRGQLAKIVSTSAGFTGPTGAQIFEDVPPNSPFYEWIQQLASRGFMSGYTCGGPNEPCVLPGNRPYFRPNNNATRGQTSKIVANSFFPNCQTPSNLKLGGAGVLP
jgi:hypothetical protein